MHTGSPSRTQMPLTQGEPAFRAVSYTPWPVEQGFEGERVRIGVGAVREPQLRTYVFEKCGSA